MNRESGEEVIGGEVSAKARVQTFLNIKQDCSTILGDKGELAQKLFGIAALDSVVGAAVESGLRNVTVEQAKMILQDLISNVPQPHP